MKKILIITALVFMLITNTVMASDVNIKAFPGEDVTFNFSFTESEKTVTSDFLIKPVGKTVLNISFKGMDKDFTATLKIIDKTAEKEIYSQPANFLYVPEDAGVDYYSYFVIYPAKLTVDHEYFIEVSDPDRENASGQIEISGNVKMLTDLARLNNMGIGNHIEQGPFNGVTRAEFAKLITQAMKMENIQSNCTFSDVDEKTPYYNDIAVIQNMKFADGNGENMYLPEKLISYYEAVKLTVCMLGYKNEIKTEGYPKGYMKKANELGLILYPDIEDRVITLEEISEILFKALETPVLEQNVFGSEASFTNGKTFSEKYRQ
ncbi:MAG: hypothetical protein E7411_05840 [Ruminococcaceae bacterium]|nr:hypothetical protein [Oscillospiraceae bacterium]